MIPESLQEYRQLLQEQEELDWMLRDQKKNKKGKGKGKNRRDRAGPAQQAHQLKRSRFHVFMNMVAIDKKFFMEFIRDPSLRKPCGMLRLSVFSEKQGQLSRDEILRSMRSELKRCRILRA